MTKFHGMLHIQVFTFNPFQENTYLLYDETKECVIVDPGCYEEEEKKEDKKEDKKPKDDKKKKEKDKPKDEEKQQQPKPQPSKLTKQDAEEKLKALLQQEKNLQDKLRKVNTATSAKPEKDW